MGGIEQVENGKRTVKVLFEIAYRDQQASIMPIHIINTSLVIPAVFP